MQVISFMEAFLHVFWDVISIKHERCIVCLYLFLKHGGWISYESLKKYYFFIYDPRNKKSKEISHSN